MVNEIWKCTKCQTASNCQRKIEVSAILNDTSIDFTIRHACTPYVTQYISEICIKDNSFDLQPSNLKGTPGV